VALLRLGFFPEWLSPVAVNYSSAILPQCVERCSVTYYELSESDSEGEQGRTGDTRRTVYTKQFLIHLRRSSLLQNWTIPL
jgi:hypothetical protein